MISIIIYVSNITNLDKTIKSIKLNTHDSLIKEIIICDDTGTNFKHDLHTTLNTINVGYSIACNTAARIATGEYLIFLKDTIKFSNDWVYHLLKTLRDNKQSLVSPVIHTLDVNNWSFEPSHWRRFGWKWDLNIYNKPNGTNESPAITNYCIACTKLWFMTLGCFDENMVYADGDSNGIELAIRSWLFGGKVYVVPDSTIGVHFNQKIIQASINNLARIVETWFPTHITKFNELVGYQNDIGKLTNLIDLQSKQTLSSDNYLIKLQPELYYLYKLRDLSNSKTIAIIADGKSLQNIDKCLFNRHDLTIGVDSVGLTTNCDYIITNKINVIESYANDTKFITPNILVDKIHNKIVRTDIVVKNSYQYEQSEYDIIPTSVTQSFVNCDDLTLTAIHIALFLKPKAITVYGYDIWSSYNQETALKHIDEKLIKSKTIFNALGKLAQSLNIPLLLMSHA